MVTVARRPLLLGLLALAATPAFAAETAADFVRRLYASGKTPLSIYAPALRAEMVRDRGRDSNRLDFDWLSGGQDEPKIAGLRVVTLNTSGPDRATVQATFTNSGEARVRRFELVRLGGVWLIVDVHMSPEALRLTKVLATPT